MSLIFRMLFRGKATSTHDKLALDALRQLKRHDAEEWQNVFLAEIDGYLKGAKAPDTEFKDFRNHVLHVRDNGWGGAIATAQQWYQKTVEALGKRDWKTAVYNAGVLSHYCTDPVQPFHTAQSEREMIVHRAAEWTICKTYEELQSLLTNECGGYPDVKVAAGNDWLAQLLRAGAEQSNAQYDFLIDHYNFEVGVRTPAAGYDREGKLTIARLIGLATVTFARVLDRAFAEAGILVPHATVSLRAFMASVSAPVRVLTNRKSDAQVTSLLGAMLAEFKQTGKVIENLPEDDRILRQLHAEEVLKISLAELNKRPAGAIGSKYTGPVPKPTPEAKPSVKTTEANKKTSDTKTIAAPATVPLNKQNAKRDDLNAPKLSPLSASGKPNTIDSVGEYSLQSPLVDAPSIGKKTAERFVPLGILTVGQFLAASAAELSKKLNISHLTPQTLEEWQHQARLMLDLPRLRSIDTQLLVGVGIHSTEDLARSNARDLAGLVKEFADSDEGKRLLRDSRPPDLVAISQWVVTAKKTRIANKAA